MFRNSGPFPATVYTDDENGCEMIIYETEASKMRAVYSFETRNTFLPQSTARNDPEVETRKAIII
jgi:hypothetical protein